MLPNFFSRLSGEHQKVSKYASEYNKISTRGFSKIFHLGKLVGQGQDQAPVKFYSNRY